ncbi:uncharacterized protein LOC109503995 [Harpegnathos saltator]|uniref:uncharacterized protein LOC109503995 n=1 Tax=Harpegnathos saltator TaxID=610380 RepID=UPI000DBEEF5E|nr:uncharacterized protein LOC109503995 [Harpegnathos saltator]
MILPGPTATTTTTTARTTTTKRTTEFRTCILEKKRQQGFSADDHRHRMEAGHSSGQSLPADEARADARRGRQRDRRDRDGLLVEVSRDSPSPGESPNDRPRDC